MTKKASQPTRGGLEAPPMPKTSEHKPGQQGPALPQVPAATEIRRVLGQPGASVAGRATMALSGSAYPAAWQRSSSQS